MPSIPRRHRDLTPPKIHTIWTSALNEAPSARVTSLKFLGRSIYEHNRRNKAANSILPPRYQVHFQIDLGISYAFLGEYKMAWASFKSALFYDEQNWIALFCFGLAKAEVGLWDEAIAPWRECLAIFETVEADALHFPIFQFNGMQDVGLGNAWTLERAVVEHNLGVASYAQEEFSVDVQCRAQGQEKQGLFGIPAGVQLGPMWDPQLEQFEEKIWAVNTTIQSKSESSPPQQSTASANGSLFPPETRQASKPLPPLPPSSARPAMREELEKVAAKMKVSKLTYFWNVPDSEIALLQSSQTECSSQLAESALYPYPSIRIPDPDPSIQPSPTFSEYQTARVKAKEQLHNRLMALVPHPISTQRSPTSESYPGDSEPKRQNSFRQSQISDVEDLIESWDEDVQKSIWTASRFKDIFSGNENHPPAYNHDYGDVEEYTDNTHLRYLSVLTAKDSLENTEGVIEELDRSIKPEPEKPLHMDDKPDTDAKQDRDEEDGPFVPPRAYSGYQFPSKTFDGNGAEAIHETNHIDDNNNGENDDKDNDSDSDSETIIGDAETPTKARFSIYSNQKLTPTPTTNPQTPQPRSQYTLLERTPNRKTMVFEQRAPNGGMRGFNARGEEILLPRAFEGYTRENERRFRADDIRARIMTREREGKSRRESQIQWVNGRATLIKEVLRGLGRG
ncbi:hypothetical protein N7G274_004247 [Stereocaulon virgatum]|uniref:TPR-like protein n=1 Tax=Stereocaulon virgatum TaxID=373712 RepID=A0ABR4AF10_9LECA